MTPSQRQARAAAAEAAAPRLSASMADCPPDIVSHIAHLGFISQLSPLFDRGDMLLQACTLACVGNSTCTALALELFRHLSPRLGQPPPEGITDRSSMPALKAALKQLGLPVTGNKGDLLRRLQEEFQDSEVDEEGAPPCHCVVSGTTRRELAGCAHRRISMNKCKDVFKLYKWQVERLPSSVDLQTRGGRAQPVTTYALADVKRLAVEKYGSWQSIEAAKQADKDRWDEIVQDSAQKRQRRIAEVRAELARRGRSAADIEELLDTALMESLTWGSREKLEAGAATDWLERTFWAATGPYWHAFTNNLHFDTWQPSAHLAQYKIREQKWERSANAAVAECVGDADSLEELRADNSIPASLLPEMVRRWAAFNAVQQQG